MKKILFIDEWIPFPPDSGKKIRTYNLIKNLSSDFDITLICFVKDYEVKNIKEIEKINIRILPVRDDRLKKWTTRFYMRVCVNLFEKVPFSTIYHIKPTFRREIISFAAKNKPDVIHCEWTNLSPFLEGCDLSKTVISSHNIESDIWNRLADQTRNPLKKLVARNQARKIEILEKYWYPKVACCTAVSRNDQVKIEEYGGISYVVENGVDVNYYSGFDSVFCAYENTIVFTASYDSFSNEDGAIYFMREHWAYIKKRLPDARLLFIGKNPTRKMIQSAAKDPAIQFTGLVDDVRPFVANAKVCVVPLRIGGGSRLKIFEAMAMRKAIVSTSIGAEGIEVTDGDELLIRDIPQNFADAVVELCLNDDKRNIISNRAYDFVSLRFDWSVIAEKQKKIWLKLCS